MTKGKEDIEMIFCEPERDDLIKKEKKKKEKEKEEITNEYHTSKL